MSCDKGSYLNGKECSKCHPDCAFCNGSLNNNCLSCSNSKHLIEDGKCVEYCSPTYEAV
jgi:hypothetical protein